MKEHGQRHLSQSSNRALGEAVLKRRVATCEFEFKANCFSKRTERIRIKLTVGTKEFYLNLML